MKSLHLTTTIVLAVAVAILIAVSIRRDSGGTAPETIAQTASMRRIERMPEFEEAMKKLGYQAWGYTWHGGMIDVVIRVSPGDKPPITYDGKLKSSQLRDLAAILSPTWLKLMT